MTLVRYESVIVFCVFILIFCLERTISENSWMRIIFVTAIMLKVLSEQLRSTLTTAFEIHLRTEDFTGMDEHRCQACTNTFDLLKILRTWINVRVESAPIHLNYYCMLLFLSKKPNF